MNTSTYVPTSFLHDAELQAIDVDRESSIAHLNFRLSDKRLCVLELHGLKAVRAEDLTLQNVVNRVLRSSTKDFSSHSLRDWLTWVTSLSDASTWLNDQRMGDWENACNSGKLELIVFEPSAGAQIAAVCERIDIRRAGLEDHSG